MALGWSELAELYARVSSLPDSMREQTILEAGLSTEDEASLRRLLAANARETAFLSTGGAIASDLKLLKPGSEVGNWKIVELQNRKGGLAALRRFAPRTLLYLVSIPLGRSYGQS